MYRVIIYDLLVFECVELRHFFFNDTPSVRSDVLCVVTIFSRYICVSEYIYLYLYSRTEKKPNKLFTQATSKKSERARSVFAGAALALACSYV